MTPRRNFSRAFTRAFTLVELLVVIGIIALLISILLPTLSRARESAKNIACLSNMRQMGNAEVMYATGWKGWGVPHIMGISPRTDWRKNTAFLRYLGVPETTNNRWPLKIHCPSANKPYLDVDKSGGADIQYSYAYNTTNMKNEYDTSGATALANVAFRGIKVSRIRRSSDKLMFADGMDWNINWQGSNYYMNPNKPGCDEYRQNGTANYVAYRHSRRFDRINVAFWDGHAASMRRDQIACCDNWWTWPASSSSHPNYKNVWDLSGQ
jgi:prepilin-type N-terminal cleavage/methylation domain-containing protein/prepilin-type processing-associated H-X9-DG protein